MVKQVYSIEIICSLAEKSADLLKKQNYTNVFIKCADGYLGWPDAAPFDAIIVTAAPDHIPEPLIKQLAVGGRMIIPVGDFYQELALITKSSKGVKQESILPVRFVPMTGRAQDAAH